MMTVRALFLARIVDTYENSVVGFEDVLHRNSTPSKLKSILFVRPIIKLKALIRIGKNMSFISKIG